MQISSHPVHIPGIQTGKLQGHGGPLCLMLTWHPEVTRRFYLHFMSWDSVMWSTLVTGEARKCRPWAPHTALLIRVRTHREGRGEQGLWVGSSPSHYKCLQHIRCSVNICPLDFYYCVSRYTISLCFLNKCILLLVWDGRRCSIWWESRFPEEGRVKETRRWLAGLEGGCDVVMSMTVAVYPEFSFLLNLDLSSALFIVYRVTLLHIHPGKVPHRQMDFVFSQNVSFPEKWVFRKCDIVETVCFRARKFWVWARLPHWPVVWLWVPSFKLFWKPASLCWG